MLPQNQQQVDVLYIHCLGSTISLCVCSGGAVLQVTPKVFLATVCLRGSADKVSSFADTIITTPLVVTIASTKLLRSYWAEERPSGVSALRDRHRNMNTNKPKSTCFPRL